MANTTSSLVVPGRPIHDWLDVLPCKFQITTFVLLPAEMFANILKSVNWYQPNYRYAWAGARLVQDI